MLLSSTGTKKNTVETHQIDVKAEQGKAVDLRTPTVEEEVDAEKFSIYPADGSSSTITVDYPRRLSASDDDSAPIVLCLPAMGVNADYYSPLTSALARQNIIAARCDLRGHGHSSERASRRNQFGYYEQIWFDIPEAIKSLKQRYPQRPIFLLGHSLGGQLATLYSAMHPEEINGLILVAAGSVHYAQFCGFRGLGVLAGTQLAWLVSTLWGSFPGHRLGFGGHESAGVIRDWARQARTGSYKLANCDHNFETLMAEARLAVFAVSIARDNLAPIKAVNHLTGKLKSATVEPWHYSPSAAELKRINHFRWVKRSQPIVHRISDWIHCQLRNDNHGKS